jgi:hypothetical protein
MLQITRGTTGMAVTDDYDFVPFILLSAAVAFPTIGWRACSQ